MAVLRGGNRANFPSQTNCRNTLFVRQPQGSEIIINIAALKRSAFFAVQWLGVEKRALQRVVFKGGFNYYTESLWLSLSFPTAFPFSPSATTCQISMKSGESAPKFGFNYINTRYRLSPIITFFSHTCQIHLRGGNSHTHQDTHTHIQASVVPSLCTSCKSCSPADFEG